MKHLFTLTLCLVSTLSLSGCVAIKPEGQSSAADSFDADSAFEDFATATQSAKQTQTDLKIETTQAGNGASAQAGDVVEVHYVGTLSDGTQFDSSRNRGEPFSFTLGAGQVIQGWDQGVEGMQIGEIRQLTIPPELGYGSQGAPPDIPPQATLNFEVELLQIIN